MQRGARERRRSKQTADSRGGVTYLAVEAHASRPSSGATVQRRAASEEDRPCRHLEEVAGRRRRPAATTCWPPASHARSIARRRRRHRRRRRRRRCQHRRRHHPHASDLRDRRRRPACSPAATAGRRAPVSPHRGRSLSARRIDTTSEVSGRGECQHAHRLVVSGLPRLSEFLRGLSMKRRHASGSVRYVLPKRDKSIRRAAVAV